MVDEPVRAPHAMIASVNALATRAGLQILSKGGNAVDAAVAVATALAVVHPEAGNLGGSGHMLIRMHDGRTAAIDYSGVAPAATLSTTPSEDLRVGYKSAAVPGTPAGLGLAHERFGRLSWREDLEPARVLADKGFPTSQRMELILQLQVPVMERFAESAKLFLHGSDRPLKEGEIVIQKDLAKTLRRMQQHGWQEFYRGQTAKLIAADMQAHGGWMTLKDLQAYRAEIHTPLETVYRGVHVLTVPPSANGGTALMVALNTMSHETIPLGMEGSSMVRHFQVEALRRGFEAVRAINAPESQLTLGQAMSSAYADQLFSTIDPTHASQTRTLPDDHRDAPETTHFSIVDAEGNIVSNTYTLSDFYGSQVVIAGTGVLLNDHMSVFSHRQGSSDQLAPFHRYRTTMASTVLLHADGSPWMAFGSPGGGTIPSTVFETVMNLVDFKMSLCDAVEYPRVHLDIRTNQIQAEPGAIVADVADKLRSMGYKLDPKLRSQGDVNAILIEEGGWREGCSDRRRGGTALGN